MLQSRKIQKRVCTLLLFVFLTVGGVRPVQASPVGGTESAESIGTSLYEVSTALTAYANSVVGPNTNSNHDNHILDELTWNSTLKPGRAGAFLGYGDVNRGFTPLITAESTKAVTTSGYDAWLKVGDGGSAYTYARYGYLLNELGLDDTGASGESSMTRNVFGFVSYLAHMGASMVPQVFDFALDILKMLNPFQFFIGDGYALTETGVGSVPTANNANSAYGNIVQKPSALKPLRDFVTSELYAPMQSIGMFVIVPLLIVFALWAVLIGKANAWGKAQALLMRMAFIVIGIPMLGVLYTSCINQMGHVVAESPAASTMVACTFVDFQTWAETSRLDLPSDVVLVSDKSDTATGTSSTDTFKTLRKSVLAINHKSGLIPDASYGGLRASLDSSSNVTVNPGMWNTSGLMTENNTVTLQTSMSSMLQRYRSGDYYRPEAWVSDVNATISKEYKDKLGQTDATGAGASNSNTVYGMYNDMNEVSDWMNRNNTENQKFFKGDVYQPFNILSNGSLVVTTSAGNVTKDSILTYTSGSTNWANNMRDPKYKGGLSTVALYNYLCTSFDDTSIATYSGSNSSSEYTKVAHYGTNLIGSGVMRFLYGANLLATMGIFTVLGVVYGLGMIFGNIKRGISMICAVPAAMLGMLKSIVQVVLYVAMMIFEIVSTIFLFTLACDLVVVFATLVENTIETIIPTTSIVGGMTATIGSYDVTSLVQNSKSLFIVGFALITVLLVALTYKACKLNRGILMAYELMMCKAYRFMSATDMVPIVDEWVRERPSLYVWDVKHIVQQDWKSVWDATVGCAHTQKGGVVVC